MPESQMNSQSAEISPGARGMQSVPKERSAEFYRKMYERTSVLGKIGVWECDLTTESLTWTDTIYDLFDLPNNLPPTRSTTLSCYEPYYREKLEAARAHAIETCSSFSIDVAIRTARGNSRWVRITGDVEEENGRAARIFGTKQDITLEKVAEIKVHALQTKLIHLSRLSAIDALRSTLAHELNQPLTAITVYLSAMRKMFESVGSDHRVEEVIERIESCALEAGGILSDMRSMGERQPQKTVVFDLDTAIREACAIALAGTSKLIKVSYPTYAGIQAHGDPVQIQQVIINLIQNALEALAETDRTEIIITVTEKDGYLEISIRDFGVGILAEVQDTLFESFVSTRADAVGIGLSICRTIIEAHQGKLTGENTLGGGATFQFTLPAPRSGHQAPPLLESFSQLSDKL